MENWKLRYRHDSKSLAIILELWSLFSRQYILVTQKGEK